MVQSPRDPHVGQKELNPVSDPEKSVVCGTVPSQSQELMVLSMLIIVVKQRVASRAAPYWGDEVTRRDGMVCNSVTGSTEERNNWKALDREVM